MHDGRDHRFECVRMVPLFAGLSVEDQHRIASVAVTRGYERREQIYRPGDRAGLYIIHRGQVKVYRLRHRAADPHHVAGRLPG